MPELPEVQTTATSLQPLLGQTIQAISVYQPQLRWVIPSDIKQLVGYQLANIERRAKYLILTFCQNASPTVPPEKKLLIHLGMSGSLQQHPQGFEKRKHDHVIITLQAADKSLTQLHYHDPRRFGAMLWLEDYQDKLIDHLGVEPLSEAFTADYLYHWIHERKSPLARPIKSVIMEQSVVVGVGNIYATESLFLAGIHPLTPAKGISKTKLAELVGFIKDVLQISIEKGGSTLRDFTVADGKTGYFQQTLRVYGRQGKPCPTCDTLIENVKITQRASTFCPTCQPLISDTQPKKVRTRATNPKKSH